MTMIKTVAKVVLPFMLWAMSVLPARAANETEIDGVQTQVQTTIDAFRICRDKVDTASRILRKIAADHGQPGELDDPEILGAIAKDLSDDERSLLQDEADAVATVPAELTAIGLKLPALTAQVDACLGECSDDRRQSLTDARDGLKDVAAEIDGLKVAADDLANEIAVLL
jgi:hypothetical protein